MVPGARVYLAGFIIHFVLLLGVSSQATLSLIARGYTMLPQSWEPFCSKAEEAVATGLGRQLSRENFLARAMTSYLHLAGIESGYGFFAPNVPDSYHLVFELHYPDQRVEYDLAGLESPESNLRLAGYLDEVGGTTSDPLREVMIKLLAASIWQNHPNAIMVRAILGARVLPGPDEFLAGHGETHEFLVAYDFAFRPNAE